jgi:hypothetical protein
MSEPTTAPTPQAALAWEAERRMPAGLAALAAALLTILGSVLNAVTLGKVPNYDDRIVTVTDALRLTVAGQPIPPGRLAAQAVWIGQHATIPIVAAILYGLGSVLVFPPIAYLFRATRARRPELQQYPLVLAAAGAVAYGVGHIVSSLARFIGATHFVHAADHTNSAAQDALGGSTYLVGAIILQAGALALGFAFVLICLNAMRVGLLTRFMGILGCIVGVTFVLPLDQQGIIRVFWLVALGALILGRWPTAIPKAWATGKAEPWPTQQQVREQREAARAQGRPATTPAAPAAPASRAPKPPTAPRPEPATAQAHPASKKRKRKRRT